MILGMMILALEVPLPIIKDFVLYRSFVVRVVLLLFQVVLNILYYQVSLCSVAMSPCQAHNVSREQMRLFGLSSQQDVTVGP